jgi:hypothetical protein
MAAGAGSCGSDDRRAARWSGQPTPAGPDSGRARDLPRHGQHGIRYSKCVTGLCVKLGHIKYSQN